MRSSFPPSRSLWLQQKAARRPTQIIKEADVENRTWDPAQWAEDVLDGRDYGAETSSSEDEEHDIDAAIESLDMDDTKGA